MIINDINVISTNLFQEKVIAVPLTEIIEQIQSIRDIITTKMISHFFYIPTLHQKSFLIGAYLQKHPNGTLASFMQHGDHHNGFEKMVELGLASNADDALNRCWTSFQSTSDYTQLFNEFRQFIFRTVEYFSNLAD